MFDPSMVWQALVCLPLFLLPAIHIISCSKSRRPHGVPLRPNAAPLRRKSTFLTLPPELRVEIFKYLSPTDRLRLRVNRYFYQLEAEWQNKVDTLLITDDETMYQVVRQCAKFITMLLNNNNGKTQLDYVAGLEKLRKNSKFNSICLKVSDTQWIGQSGGQSRSNGNELMRTIMDTAAPRMVTDIKDNEGRRDWLSMELLVDLWKGRAVVAFPGVLPMLNDYRALQNLLHLHTAFTSSDFPLLRSLHFDLVPTSKGEALLSCLGVDQQQGLEYTVGRRVIEAHTKGNAVIAFEQSNDRNRGIFGIHRVNEDGSLPVIPLDAMGRRELDLDQE